jgi:hypothetical protein
MDGTSVLTFQMDYSMEKMTFQYKSVESIVTFQVKNKFKKLTFAEKACLILL